MKINDIKLINFGSYEGENVFETNGNGKRNIILIGGKNGAGKTSLFTAMRVCLYGYLSMGYKNANSFYTRAITKLINNSAKINKPVMASVSMSIELSNGRGPDQYILTRQWLVDDSITESFSIDKNGLLLESEEVADFEKYLLSLIPPELFNLYFFNGEKIADFFLDEGSSTRIKEAFLTLCGYDTFDIMRKNFKKTCVSRNSQKENLLKAYIATRELTATEKEKLDEANQKLSVCITEIENCDSDITALERDYFNKGGITEEEWNQKLVLIKEEERKRENWNNIMRKWANDIIPFIMISTILKKVKAQIRKENDNQKCRSFVEIINHDAMTTLLEGKKELVEQTAISLFGSPDQNILDLSFEQSAALLGRLNELLAFDVTKVAKCKQLIKQSIKKSARIRKELEQSSIATVHEYMRVRSELFEKKSNLLDERIQLEAELYTQKSKTEIASAAYIKAQSILEAEIKKESINDISAKAIIMLDKLQANLYHRQIEKVEDSFRHNISILMRKTRFIDDISIDDRFNIHVFRNEEISIEKIKSVIISNTEEQFLAMLGAKALQCLKSKFGDFEFGTEVVGWKESGNVVLPVEIDKTTFSNGEKQIFIMALYYSLVQLGNHEIPFVIDTPFARIDTEHRQNIARYFFCELKGQVFILSTNEEITATHVHIMKDKILAKYMLENSDNQKTVVIKDSYFEV